MPEKEESLNQRKKVHQVNAWLTGEEKAYLVERAEADERTHSNLAQILLTWAIRQLKAAGGDWRELVKLDIVPKTDVATAYRKIAERIDRQTGEETHGEPGRLPGGTKRKHKPGRPNRTRRTGTED